jgi:membrane protein CcdC involved in cytochrome C biogenesis
LTIPGNTAKEQIRVRFTAIVLALEGFMVLVFVKLRKNRPKVNKKGLVVKPFFVSRIYFFFLPDFLAF